MLGTADIFLGLNMMNIDYSPTTLKIDFAISPNTKYLESYLQYLPLFDEEKNNQLRLKSKSFGNIVRDVETTLV